MRNSYRTINFYEQAGCELKPIATGRIPEDTPLNNGDLVTITGVHFEVAKKRILLESGSLPRIDYVVRRLTDKAGPDQPQTTEDPIVTAINAMDKVVKDTIGE